MKLAGGNGRVRGRIAAFLVFGAVLGIALAAVALYYARKPISLKGAIIQELSLIHI